MLCCFGGSRTSPPLQSPTYAPTELTKDHIDANPLPASGNAKLTATFSRLSLGPKAEGSQHRNGANGGASTSGAVSANDALLQLLPVLTSLDGGWWDQLERAVVATAQHLLASHACVFHISGDAAVACPVALTGPPAPPLCVGVPLPLPGAAQPQPHTSAAGPLRTAASGPVAAAGESGPMPAAGPPASAPLAWAGAAAAGGAAAGVGAGAGAMGGPGPPSCAAASLLGEQGDRSPGTLLLFTDAAAGKGVGAGAGRGAGNGAGGPLPPSAPPEWRHLATSGAARHFAAVAIPLGSSTAGVLSLGAEGPGRPASWSPEALHSTAALLSAPVRAPQVDLACRALVELAAADTVHQVVRIALGAAEQLVVAVTRIETQARVAFLQPDVEAAAVFQSAATDVLGPAMRRRLSEVLLVDTAARAAGGGGGGGAAGSGGPQQRGGGGGPPARRSLGGNEALPSRCSSVAAAGVGGDRDSFMGTRVHVGGDEVPVCRGHSLPLKHTLLSEALAQGTGLCIADCNAYVQDSKVYPRDLAVSRGAAPAQSLALATGLHEGRPLLALYATYNSILPQALLQTVVQELGQLLRALGPAVAAKVAGPLAVEWAQLRHQLLESLRNRSLRSVNGASAQLQQQQQQPAAAGSGHNPLSPPHHHQQQHQQQQQHPHHSPHPQHPRPARSSSHATLSTGGTHAGAPPSPPPALALAAAASAAASGAGGLEVPLSQAASIGVGLLEGAASGSMGTASEQSRGREGRHLGRASFSLEAATSPRGSCKLAPLIATLHDRLKAAQAEQMANCRAASRLQDLESIRILEQIGRGGYGVVYRGLYHGSEVAIKVIQEAEVAAVADSGSGGRGGGLKRMNSVALQNKHLHDAIELVASVGMGGHPNIVQVLTFFTDVCVMVGDRPADSLHRSLSDLDGVAELLRLTRMPTTHDSLLPAGLAGGGAAAEAEAAGRGGGVIVLVQEFCDAGTLKTAINQRAFYERAPHPADVAAAERSSRGHLQLNLRAVYSTLLEVALALRHMHGLHMVHCDLKPQNVLLKSSPRDPRGFTAKLSDFGLAKMMAHDEGGQLVIDEAVGSGTLTHMAPESLAGQKQLTASIDLFSFGILMWQMVCGTRLYQGLTTKQIIRGVVRENLRPAFPAWVPPDYRRLAERCWHPLPAERPSAGAVVGELEAMVDATSRGGGRSWRAINGGGAGAAAGLDSPRARPHAHQHHQPHQQQHQPQPQQAAGHQHQHQHPASPRRVAAQQQPQQRQHQQPSQQPHHHHHHLGAYAQPHHQQPQYQHQLQGQGQAAGGPGRPQAGNTGAGAGPSLLII